MDTQCAIEGYHKTILHYMADIEYTMHLRVRQRLTISSLDYMHGVLWEECMRVWRTNPPYWEIYI